MKTKFALVILLISGCFLQAPARAADHSAIMPFVTDDVVAIAYVDLNAVNLTSLLDIAESLGALPPEARTTLPAGMREVDGIRSRFVDGGVSVAYVLLRTSDIQFLGPTWVFPLNAGANAEAVIQLLKDSQAGVSNPGFLADHYRVVDGAVVAAKAAAQLDRLATVRSSQPREQAVSALAALGDGGVGLVVLGDADSRRVLREMFPRLPVPFDDIDGRMIAEDLLWLGAEATLTPRPQVMIHIQTSAPEVARTVQHSAGKALELVEPMVTAQLAERPAALPAAVVRETLTALKPTIEGNAVRLTLGDDVQQLDRLRALFSPSMASAREAAERNQRINQFKQLALAFWNYESTHGKLITQANYDPDGKPLLSWRVHLLPYLEQQALYAEFHLDEPWDSPHNRKLVERMPDVYADPSATSRRAIGAGRTTFLAPVGDETLFPTRTASGQPLTIRDVKDGTSKTILFVEVVPQRAVVWTQPEDWTVDLNQSRDGVARSDRAGFVAAFCDGHVRFISNDVEASTLRGMLTRAGGEVIDP